MLNGWRKTLDGYSSYMLEEKSCCSWQKNIECVFQYQNGCVNIINYWG